MILLRKKEKNIFTFFKIIRGCKSKNLIYYAFCVDEQALSLIYRNIFECDTLKTLSRFARNVIIIVRSPHKNISI